MARERKTGRRGVKRRVAAAASAVTAVAIDEITIPRRWVELPIPARSAGSKNRISRDPRAGDAALRRLLSRAEIARAVDENARDALADVPRKIVERHLISRARGRRTHAAPYPICGPLRLSENLADYETLAFVVFPLYLVTDVFFFFFEKAETLSKFQDYITVALILSLRRTYVQGGP